MNGRNKKNGTNIGKIGDLSTKYRSYIGQISKNIADIIGTDILTNILYIVIKGAKRTLGA
ncbi:hypothetical protein Hanom_Chr01g00005921 [Helianthus anomalus]